MTTPAPPQISRSERAASAVVAFMGSVRFIVLQTIVVAIWLALNGTAVALRFDPYPFILLNLLFSTQAAYAAPLILLSQNRAAERDRRAAQKEAAEVTEIDQIEREDVALLRQMNALLLLQHQHMDLPLPLPDDASTKETPP